MFVKMNREKEFKGIFLMLFILTAFGAKADTWYPAGNNILNAPVAIYANGDYFFTIHKTKVNTDSFDYYTPARYDGKTWYYFPMLKVYAGAEVNAIIRFGDELVVGGNFKLPSGKFNSLVHINFNTKIWDGIGLFSNSDTSKPNIRTLEVFNGDLYAGGKFKALKGVTYNNIIRFNKVFTPFVLEKNTVIGTQDGIVNVLSANSGYLAIGGTFTNLLDDKAVSNLAVVTYSGGIYTIVSKPVSFKGSVLGGKWFGNLFYISHDFNGQKSILAFNPANGLTPSANSNISFIGLVNGFFIYDGKLHAFGDFKVNAILHKAIKFDGSTWTGLGLPFKPEIFMAVFQDKLLATGIFQGFSIRQNYVCVLQLLTGINRLSGKAYFDANANCLIDGNDKPLSGRWIILSGQRNSLTRTDENGNWEFLISSAPKNITIKAEQPLYWGKPVCENGSKTFAFNGRDSSNLNFASIIAQQVNDLEVTLTSDQGWKARKDFRESYNIKVQNNGTKQTDGSVTFKYDRKIDGDVTFSIPPNKVGTNELTWDIKGINPGEVRNFLVYPLIKSSQLNLNDQIQSSATISNPNDLAPKDNTDTIRNLISGATATFGKFASPNPTNGDTSIIKKGQDEIFYTISFENNGTDTVKTVRVIDTLDLTYFIGFTQETGASHPYTTYIYQDPTNIYKGIFVWTFNNINLPPNPTKNPEAVNSRGYIGFKVHFDANTPVGTVVKNTASVIFDQGINNLTNAVWCKYDQQNNTGIKNIPLLGLQVYPNPANEVLNLKFIKPFKGKAELFDLSGKLMTSETLEGVSLKTISTSSIANGVYLLKISGNEESTVIKTVIAR